MEPKFQTSFIPKKPLSQAATSAPSGGGSQNTSILFLVGVLVFVVSILVAGGAYGYEYLLNNSQQQLQSDLAKLEKGFDIESISSFKQLDTKISIAKQLLTNHVALSQIFDFISRLTAANIRFINLDVAAPTDRSKGVTIRMSGFAPSYEALAFQSDSLGRLSDLDLKNVIINPAISNPAQSQTGTVSFEFSANVQPSQVLYSNTFSLTDTGTSSVDTNSNQ
jgi:hypothetical protein